MLQGGRTDGQIMALQLMGGDMQSQGHAQVMVNMVDLGANLQAASDMARFHHNQVTRHRGAGIRSLQAGGRRSFKPWATR